MGKRQEVYVGGLLTTQSFTISWFTFGSMLFYSAVAKITNTTVNVYTTGYTSTKVLKQNYNYQEFVMNSCNYSLQSRFSSVLFILTDWKSDLFLKFLAMPLHAVLQTLWQSPCVCIDFKFWKVGFLVPPHTKMYFFCISCCLWAF